jgi:hypothetical protein
MLRYNNENSQNGVRPQMTLSLPSILVIIATISFFIYERVRPGRPLPKVKGWYPRVIFINLIQLALTLATGRLWYHLMGEHSLVNFRQWDMPLLEGRLDKAINDVNRSKNHALTKISNTLSSLWQTAEKLPTPDKLHPETPAIRA